MKYLINLYLKFKGWQFKNILPEDLGSCVVIGAPHTSNFDFLPAMGLIYNLKRHARFVIKDSWMKFPLNLFMVPVGAIGLDRDKIKEIGHQSTTDLMAHLFEREKDLFLLIAPEGTRKKVTEWKTGFYYIAQKAKVPLAIAYADHKTKTYGIGKIIFPTDYEKDMKDIMQFYKNILGCIPENFALDHRF